MSPSQSHNLDTVTLGHVLRTAPRELQSRTAAWWRQQETPKAMTGAWQVLTRHVENKLDKRVSRSRNSRPLPETHSAATGRASSEFLDSTLRSRLRGSRCSSPRRGTPSHTPPPAPAWLLLCILSSGLFSFTAPTTPFYCGMTCIYCLVLALKCKHVGPLSTHDCILGACTDSWDTGTPNETVGKLPPLPVPQSSQL